MSESFSSIPISTDLGARLQVLFFIDRTPETLGEFGELLQESLTRRLQMPEVQAYFQAISTGKTIFGEVNYQTRHRLKLPNDKQVFVACALDALIEGRFLPIEIESSCFHCEEPIRIRMAEGSITFAEPSSAVLWLGASPEGKGSCLTYLCPYINFFSAPEHLDEWKDAHPTELGIKLTLQQSLNLAHKGYWTPIFRIEPEA